MKEIKNKTLYALFDEIWGPHSIFSVLAFVIGGILVGRTVWELVHNTYGSFITIIIGIVLLSLGGIVLHKFDD